MLSQKIRKIGTGKKHCKTQYILMVGGLSWGHVGPSWGYVGPILGLSWPILGLCWPFLGLCWPILGLCWPILGAMFPASWLCWSILRPMLAHVDRATKAEKWEKIGRAQNTVKRGGFWPYRLYCGRGGGSSLLWRGENCRTASTRPACKHGRWRPSREERNKCEMQYIEKEMEAKVIFLRLGVPHSCYCNSDL